jgi:hypothetical protein
MNQCIWFLQKKNQTEVFYKVVDNSSAAAQYERDDVDPEVLGILTECV